jgi:regulator of replication initiation timing
MGVEGGSVTKKNWQTDSRLQNQLQLQGKGKERDAEKGVTKNSQNYDWKDILSKLYSPNFGLCNSALSQLRARRGDHIYARMQ